MAYRSVKSIAYRAVPLVRRELYKQLTTIVLIQVAFNINTATPYIITTSVITNINMIVDQITLSKLSLVSTITLLLEFINFAVSIYYNKTLNLFYSRVHYISAFVFRNDFVDNSNLYYQKYYVVK